MRGLFSFGLMGHLGAFFLVGVLCYSVCLFGCQSDRKNMYILWRPFDEFKITFCGYRMLRSQLELYYFLVDLFGSLFNFH